MLPYFQDFEFLQNALKINLRSEMESGYISSIFRYAFKELIPCCLVYSKQVIVSNQIMTQANVENNLYLANPPSKFKRNHVS